MCNKGDIPHFSVTIVWVPATAKSLLDCYSEMRNVPFIASVGEQARVVDAEFAQSFHVHVEFLDAGEGTDAYAM